MPDSCAAIDCTSRANKEAKRQGITFHFIPKDETRRREWLRAIRRKNWDPGNMDIWVKSF